MVWGLRVGLLRVCRVYYNRLRISVASAELHGIFWESLCRQEHCGICSGF